MNKPRIAPYRRHDRPGKWACRSFTPAGHEYIGTGYTPAEAYARWRNAVHCQAFWPIYARR
jgi:hypothetical protein